MHKVDEHVLTDDIDQLTAIYLAMLSRFFEVAR
jgi:acetylornithine deacetylase/succinyl-diaminopimelate desuccinylase-like protein